jgi:hypothetical protein
LKKYIHDKGFYCKKIWTQDLSLEVKVINHFDTSLNLSSGALNNG